MLSKICKECFIDKLLSEYYAHPQWVLWTLPRCKECILKWRRSERERAMAKPINKKRSKKLDRMEYRKNGLIKYRKKYPEKYKAQRMVAKFLNKNPSYKQTRCSVTWLEWWIIHMHHYDYSKPNMVIPCNPQTHSDFHTWRIQEIKPEWILELPFQ